MSIHLELFLLLLIYIAILFLFRIWADMGSFGLCIVWGKCKTLNKNSFVFTVYFHLLHKWNCCVCSCNWSQGCDWYMWLLAVHPISIFILLQNLRRLRFFLVEWHSSLRISELVMGIIVLLLKFSIHLHCETSIKNYLRNTLGSTSSPPCSCLLLPAEASHYSQWPTLL